VGHLHKHILNPFGKKPIDWLKTQQSKDYLVELSKVKNITLADLVIVRKGEVIPARVCTRMLQMSFTVDKLKRVLRIMNELIKIEDRDGKKLVNARELHAYLGSKQDFSNWIINRIDKYGFQEDKDFTIVLLKSTGGRPAKEYALTIDMAKQLCMV
jgi:phage anti-repressor protein